MSSLKTLLGLLLLIPLVVYGSSPASSSGLVLGVSAYLPRDEMVTRYTSLTRYLSEQLQRPVTLKVISEEQLNHNIASGSLDLFIATPIEYLLLKQSRRGFQPIATMSRKQGGHTTRSFGGVLFTRADQADRFVHLSDISGQTIGVTHPSSLGGYLAQIYEFKEAGIRWSEIWAMSLGSAEAVVSAVLRGDVAVGAVRSGVLEEMGYLEQGSERLAIINQQALGEFPYPVSTRLYPEWPVLAESGMSDRLLRQIVAALASLDADHPAAQSMGSGGFFPPEDYSQLIELLEQLQEYHTPTKSAWVFWDRYPLPYRIAMMVGLALVGLALMWAVGRYRRLMQELSSLKRAFQQWPEPLMRYKGGRFIDCNQAAIDKMKMPNRASFLAMDPISISPEFQAGEKTTQERFEQVIDKLRWGRVHQMTWRHQDALGTPFWVELTLVGLNRGNAKSSLEVFCRWRDVSANYQEPAEHEKVRALRSRLNDLIGDGYWVWRQSNQQFTPDSLWSRALGIAVPENGSFTVDQWIDLIHPDDLHEATSRVTDMITGKRPQVRANLRVRGSNGEWLQIERIAEAVQPEDDEGELIVVGVDRAVGWKLQALAGQELFQRLLAISPDAICLLDDSGCIVTANRAFAALVDRDEQSLKGAALQECGLCTEDDQPLPDVEPETLKQGHWRGVLRARPQAGQPFSVQAELSQCYGQDGQPGYRILWMRETP